MRLFDAHMVGLTGVLQDSEPGEWICTASL